jgi:hypothetical protein
LAREGFGPGYALDRRINITLCPKIIRPAWNRDMAGEGADMAIRGQTTEGAGGRVFQFDVFRIGFLLTEHFLLLN